MTTISKTTFTFTVLHRTDDPPEDLEAALRESWDGNAVGLETAVEVVGVADEDVSDQLVLLGNDGDFFNDDLTEEL